MRMRNRYGSISGSQIDQITNRSHWCVGGGEMVCSLGLPAMVGLVECFSIVSVPLTEIVNVWEFPTHD